MIERLELSGDDRLMAEPSKYLKTFIVVQQSIYEAIHNSPANKLLKDL
jgi:hypothetical protein